MCTRWNLGDSYALFTDVCISNSNSNSNSKSLLYQQPPCMKYNRGHFDNVSNTTLHYTSQLGKLVVLQTQHKTKTHLYIDTRTHVHVRVWKYTHISKHTRVYIYINIIHLTHGARAPPFCHPLSLSNHSKSRWQSGGNHIEWDTHIYIHFKSKLPLLIKGKWASGIFEAQFHPRLSG